MAPLVNRWGSACFGEGWGGGSGSESGDCHQDLSKRACSQLLAESLFQLLAVADCSVEGVGEVGDDLGPGFCGGKFYGLGFHRFPDTSPARSPELPDGGIFTENVQDSGAGQPVADNPFQAGAGAEQRVPETVDDPCLIGGQVFVVAVQSPHTSQLPIGCLHDMEPVQVAAGVIRQNPGVFRIRFSGAVV